MDWNEFCINFLNNVQQFTEELSLIIISIIYPKIIISMILLAISALLSLALANQQLLLKTSVTDAQIRKRIDLKLYRTGDYYFGMMIFGNQSIQKFNVLIDTQNDWSFVVGTECSTCNATHTYTNTSQVRESDDFGSKNVRQIGLTGKSVVDKACLVDTAGVNHCINELKFGVISSQNQASINIDGVLGLRPQVQADDYSIIAALYNNNMISKMEAYLDISNNKLHLGDFDEKSMYRSYFINYPADQDQWQIKIRDIRYNSTYANFSSLNDSFTRHARLDTAFRGIAVPSSIWPTMKNILISSIQLPPDMTLDCTLEYRHLGKVYNYCSFNTSCDKTTFGTISLQLSGVEAFLYSPSDYLNNVVYDGADGKSIWTCRIQIFGIQDIDQDYYILGNDFLRNYYVLFNYTSNTVGFNGPYYIAEDINDKPDYVPTSSSEVPLWVWILLIAIIVGSFILISVCTCIRKRNSSLKEKLNQEYSSMRSIQERPY
ncbi:hypothetical protein FGO68_gene3759 [Halteria grandinella]|uniref:Peptidase A1 domain-containing protein n=1 Tax=Halteria grandinella TaxID=5974 RepID=A0A8J8NPK2_HALGN|nr:hypothetical protein FGO68_gene3759 [Halteria grandinella]